MSSRVPGTIADLPPAAGQGALVQQHRRQRRGVGMREDLRGLDDRACVIVKHANPCGVALAATPLEAYRKALATDPTSAFGGIIAFNRPVDAATRRGGRGAVRRSADRARPTPPTRSRCSRRR